MLRDVAHKFRKRELVPSGDIFFEAEARAVLATIEWPDTVPHLANADKDPSPDDVVGWRLPIVLRSRAKRRDPEQDSSNKISFELLTSFRWISALIGREPSLRRG